MHKHKKVWNCVFVNYSYVCIFTGELCSPKISCVDLDVYVSYRYQCVWELVCVF